MRAFFGFLQFAFGLGGLIALFNGQFLGMITAWAGAFAVGWLGNRVVKFTMGVSQSGQDSLSSIPTALRLLESGSYSAAEGTALGAVNSFRRGGDTGLLQLALVLHAVALGANAKFDQARRAIDEAETLYLSAPGSVREINSEIRPAMEYVRRELHNGQPDSARLVAGFLELSN